MAFSLSLSLDFQKNCAQILVHLCELAFGVKRVLTLAEKSGVLVDGASIAANSPSIDTEQQNKLKQQRLKEIGTFMMFRRSLRTHYRDILNFSLRGVTLNAKKLA